MRCFEREKPLLWNFYCSLLLHFSFIRYFPPPAVRNLCFIINTYA